MVPLPRCGVGGGGGGGGSSGGNENNQRKFRNQTSDNMEMER